MPAQALYSCRGTLAYYTCMCPEIYRVMKLQLLISHDARIASSFEATERLYVGDLCDNIGLVLTYLLSGAISLHRPAIPILCSHITLVLY